jgi:hypothetical protein
MKNIRIIWGTIVKPKQTFVSDTVRDDKIHGIFISFFQAIWYMIAILIMYFKGRQVGLETNYFIFESLFWVFIFAPCTVMICYFFPEKLTQKLVPEAKKFTKTQMMNVLCLAFGVCSLFIAAVDMIIVITASPLDVLSYTSGTGMTAPLAYLSTPIFSLISIWLIILAVYGFRLISGATWGKSIIITLMVLVPLLIILFLLIALESVQPF